MAHELEIREGKAMMFSAGNQTPWHGLGTVIEQESVTSQEAIKLAGLDWTVEQREVMYDHDGSQHVVPNQFVNVRTLDGAALGVVGGRYKILQNKDAFTFMDDLVDDGSAKYVTAGSLFGGSQVWALMQIPGTIRITDSEDEDINKYILLQNSHDGSRSISVCVTPVRVVCNNTLTLALDTTQRTYKVRHTTNLIGKLAEGRKVLGIAHAYNNAIKQLATDFINSPLSSSDFDNFLETLVPTKDLEAEFLASQKQSSRGLTVALNRQEDIRDIYQNTPDLQNIKGTKWGALQAVIDYNDHHMKGRGENQIDKRMKRIIDLPNLTHQAHKILTRI